MVEALPAGFLVVRAGGATASLAMPLRGWPGFAESPALVREPPTLARRFPVGPGDSTSTRWYLHCPYLMKSLSDHLLSAVSRTVHADANVTGERRRRRPGQAQTS